MGLIRAEEVVLRRDRLSRVEPRRIMTEQGALSRSLEEGVDSVHRAEEDRLNDCAGPGCDLPGYAVKKKISLKEIRRSILTHVSLLVMNSATSASPTTVVFGF